MSISSITNEKGNFIPKITSFRIIPLPSPKCSPKNEICLSTSDIKKLSGKRKGKFYIEINDRIYKVSSKFEVEKGSIGMQMYQIREIEQYIFSKNGSDHIAGILKTKDTCMYADIQKLKVDVTYLPFKENNDTRIDIFASEIKRLTMPFLKKNFLSFDQDFAIQYSNGFLHFKIAEMIFQSTESPVASFGRIGNNTRISYNSINQASLKILNTTVRAPDDFLYLMVNLKKTEEALPLKIYTSELKKLFINKFFEEQIWIGKELTLRLDSGTVLSFETKKIIDIGAKSDASALAYRLAEDQKLLFYTQDNRLIFLEDQPKVCTSTEMEIILFEYVDQEKKQRWIDANKIRNAIAADNTEILQNRFFSIETDEFKMILRANSFELADDEECLGKHLWKVGAESKINLCIAEDLEFELIENMTPVNASKIIIIVKSDKFNKKIQINKDTFVKLIHENLPATFHKGMRFPLSIDKNSTLFIKITGFSSEDNDNCERRFAQGHHDLEIVIESIPENLTITSSLPSRFLSDPVSLLEEMGIGGISNESIKQLQRITLTRTTLAPELQKMRIKLPKGLLLSGPPGTGKTKLARNMGAILGIPKENVVIKDASEFMSKWLGESAELIRELFADAKKEYKEKGKEAAPFLFIIDEIDSIFRNRSEAHNEYAAATNQFLTILDGIEESDNFIVIGITNRANSLDPAIRRTGRLHPTIEFSLPDFNGRISIFKIHCQELIKNGYMCPTLRWKKLADESKMLSGSDIEGAINETFMNWSLMVASGKVEKSQKITTEDLIDAVRLISSQRNQDSPPVQMYI